MELLVLLAILLVLWAVNSFISVVAKSVNLKYEGGGLFLFVGLFIGTLFADQFPHATPSERDVGMFITGTLGCIIASILVLLWQNLPQGSESVIGRVSESAVVVKVVRPAATLVGSVIGVLCAVVILFIFFRDTPIVSPLIKWIFNLFHH